MSKRAADGVPRGSAWVFLERIDSELAVAVCAIYANPLQFDGAFDTMDEAADLVKDLLPASTAGRGCSYGPWPGGVEGVCFHLVLPAS